jgi:hypothetical protein
MGQNIVPDAVIVSLAATASPNDCRPLTAFFGGYRRLKDSGREIRPGRTEQPGTALKLMSAGSPVGRGSDGFDIGPVGFDAAALEDGGACHQHVGTG